MVQPDTEESNRTLTVHPSMQRMEDKKRWDLQRFEEQVRRASYCTI